MVARGLFAFSNVPIRMLARPLAGVAKNSVGEYKKLTQYKSFLKLGKGKICFQLIIVPL